MSTKDSNTSSWLLKPLKILLAAALLGSSLAGCTSDDDAPDEPQTQDSESTTDTTDSSDSKESKKTTEANEASEAPAADEKPETQTDTQTYTASEMTVTYLDVGQASAALIESDGHYALIDGGNREDSDLIFTVLKNKGVTNLDVIIGSHSHEDHIGGLAGALNEATASTVLCPVTSGDTKTFQSFAKYASEKGPGITVPSIGDTYTVGDAKITILGLNAGDDANDTSIICSLQNGETEKGPGITVPSIGDTYTVGDAKITILGLNAGDDANDTSIICSLQNGETSFLFSGDAEYPAEQAVLNSDYASLLKSNVYTVGHHGSDTSTSNALLDAIDPQYGIISCGRNNSYGHPDTVVLNKLKDHGVKILRTASIICSLQNGETSFLFSGDAEYPAEQAVLNSDYASLLKSNVYTVGHHGSDTSTSNALLDAIDPQYGIISCGRNNSYGHPDTVVLNKLKDHGVKILRTDLQGDITCKSDGKTVACEPSKKPDADVMVPGTKAEDKSEADQAAAAPAPVPQSSEYVLNTSTHKFHRPDCRSVAKMKDKNKEVVNESRDQIIAQGYEPCKICQP